MQGAARHEESRVIGWRGGVVCDMGLAFFSVLEVVLDGVVGGALARAGGEGVRLAWVGGWAKEGAEVEFERVRGLMDVVV